MTKLDLVSLISKDTKITQKTTLKIVDSMCYHVQRSIAKGARLDLRGFGSFYVKEKAPRIVRDIRRNIAISLDKRHVPVFKPSKNFQERVQCNMGKNNL